MADSEKDPHNDHQNQHVIEIVPLNSTEGDEIDGNCAVCESKNKFEDESVSVKDSSQIENVDYDSKESHDGKIDEGMSREVNAKLEDDDRERTISAEVDERNVCSQKELEMADIPTMDDFEGNDGRQIVTEGDNTSNYQQSSDEMKCERTPNDVEISDKPSDAQEKDITDKEKCKPDICTSNDDDHQAKTNTSEEMDLSYSDFAKHVDSTSAPKLVNYSLESPDISLDEGIMFRRDENQDSIEEDSDLNLELELSKESDIDVKPRKEWDSIVNTNFVRKKLKSYEDTDIPDNRPSYKVDNIRRSIDDIGINDRRKLNKPILLTREELAEGLQIKTLNVPTNSFQPKIEEQSDGINILNNRINSKSDSMLYGQVDDNNSFSSNAFSPEHVIGTAIKTEFKTSDDECTYNETKSNESREEQTNDGSGAKCTSTDAIHALHSTDERSEDKIDVQCTPNDVMNDIGLSEGNEGAKEIDHSGDQLKKDSISVNDTNFLDENKKGDTDNNPTSGDLGETERVPRGRNRTTRMMNATRKRRDTCSVPKPFNRKKLPKPRPLKASTKKRILRTFKKMSKAESDDDWMKGLSDKQIESMEESDLQEAIKQSVNDYVSKNGTMLNQTCFTAYHIPELQDLQDAMLTNNEFDTQVLTVKLLSLNRRVQSVAGDGNCLFSSVADQLRNHPTRPIDVTQADVRRLVIDHLRDNKEELELVLIDYLKDYGLNYDQYCEYMSRDRVWGDLVCHFVLARVLNIPYTIVLPYENIAFNEDKVNEEDQFQHEITVVYNGFNHYSSSRKYCWDNYIRDKIRLANIDDKKKLDVNFEELMSKDTDLKLLYDTVINTGLNKLAELKATPPDTKEENAMRKITEESATKTPSPSSAKNITSEPDAFDEKVDLNISSQGNVDECTSNNSKAGNKSKSKSDVGSKNKGKVNGTPKKDKDICEIIDADDKLGKSFRRAKKTMDRKMGDPDFTPCPQHIGKLCASPCGLCIFYTIKTKKEKNKEQSIPEIASEVIISKPPKKRYGLNQETVTKLRNNLSKINSIGPELRKAIEDACMVDVEDDDENPKEVEEKFRLRRRKRFVTPPRDQASSTEEDIPDTAEDYMKAITGTKTKSSLKKSLMEKKAKNKITFHPSTKPPAKSPSIKSPNSSVEIINQEEFTKNLNKIRTSPRLQFKKDKVTGKCASNDAKSYPNKTECSTSLNIKKDKRTSMDDSPSSDKNKKLNVSGKTQKHDKNVEKSLVPIDGTPRGKSNTSKSKRTSPVLDLRGLKFPSTLRSGFVRSPPFLNPLEKLTRDQIDIEALNVVEEDMRNRTNAVLDSIGQDNNTRKIEYNDETTSTLLTPTRLRIRPGRSIAEELMEKVNNLCQEDKEDKKKNLGKKSISPQKVSAANKSTTKDKRINEDTSSTSSNKVSPETKSTRKDKKTNKEIPSTSSKKKNVANVQEFIQQKVIETRSRAKLSEQKTQMSATKRTSNDGIDSSTTPAKKPKSANGGKGTKRNAVVKPKKTFQTKDPEAKHKNMKKEIHDFEDCEDADEYNSQEEEEEEYVIPDKKRRKMIYYCEPKTSAEKKSRQPVTCDICKKRFINKDNLNRHSKSVHEVRKFICPKCPKTYSRKNTLRQHIRTAHEGYRYICTEKDCGEKFLRKEQLNYHILAHQGEFRYVCAVCGKGYQHRANFEQHQNTHLGKKVLKCGKCDRYATNYNGDLTRHVKTCGVKPYIPCTFKGCSEKFTCQEYLRSHLNRTHKQGDPIICRVCGRQFYHTSSISAHMKSHENE